MVPKHSKTEKVVLTVKKITVLYFDNKSSCEEKGGWGGGGELKFLCCLEKSAISQLTFKWKLIWKLLLASVKNKLTIIITIPKKLRVYHWNKIKTHQVSDIYKILFITPWPMIRLIKKVFTYTLYLSGWYLRASFR